MGGVRIFLALILLGLPGITLAAMADDDPVLTKLEIEELEWRKASGDEVLSWDVLAWVGRDRDKAVLKAEGERNDDETEDFEAQLLYQRSVSAFWNLQAGWRHDWQPDIERDWFAIGLSGLAPGFIETEATLFIGEAGRQALRVKTAYEWMFTRRLSLEPKLELNWYTEDDIANGLGSGLSDVELGLRLHYALRRKIKPYVGLNWEKLSGDTADIARAEGESDSEIQVLAGLSWWF